MYRISIFFFFIFLTSCSMNRMIPNTQLKEKMEIDFVSYKIQNSDSFNVHIILKIPLKFIVFKKHNNQFIGNVSYTFNANNRETKAVVNRITENRSITVSYYEDTHAEDQFFQIESEIILAVGEYDLLSIIQDIDNHKIIKKTTKMNVGNLPVISKLTAFYYEGQEKYYISKVVKEDIDTVWLKFQMDD